MDLSAWFEFKCPARIVFGVNSVDRLGEEIGALNGKKGASGHRQRRRQCGVAG